MDLIFAITVIIPGLYGLLHVAGLILALVYWRRCPKACAVLFTASTLNLLATLMLSLLLVLAPGLDRTVLDAVFFVASILQWIAYGLLLLAVFAGRNDDRPREARPARPFPDDNDDWRLPKAAVGDGTGIQG